MDIEKIEIPEGVEVSFSDNTLIVKGAKGEVKRKWLAPQVTCNIKDKTITLTAESINKRKKKIAKTYKAHINNMIRGSMEGHSYTVKICSSHFPMTVTVEGNSISVKNYLGESVPRIITIREGAEVKVEGDKINISSPDKELAGQIAGSLERLCSPGNKDRRIFQDGLYIIEKDGKELA